MRIIPIDFLQDLLPGLHYTSIIIVRQGKPYPFFQIDVFKNLTNPESDSGFVNYLLQRVF